MEPVIFAAEARGMPPGWARAWYGAAGPEKAARLRRMPERKAELSVMGELLARYALWKVSGVRPAELRFGALEGGKPVVTFPRGYHFNISHSGAWCACAAADAPVGIDLQQMTDHVRFEAVARRFFEPQEQLAYARAADRKAMFYTLWTKREALGKCVGAGLRPLPERLPPVRFSWATLADCRLCVCWETKI